MMRRIDGGYISRSGWATVALLWLACVPHVAGAQVTRASPIVPAKNGAGHRLSGQAVAPGLEVVERIDLRVPNRVQSRLRNRIDPTYDAQANALSPFVIADTRARRGGRRAGRGR